MKHNYQSKQSLSLDLKTLNLISSPSVSHIFRNRKKEEKGIGFLSFNQSRAVKSEGQVRKSGRSGSFSQQRSFPASRGKGGSGTAHLPSSSSVSSSPSLSTNRSFKKSSNGQGGQSRMGQTGLNSESNVAVVATRVSQNGARVQSQLQDAPASGAAKTIDSSIPKGSRALPKAPSSQPASRASGSSTPGTPSKVSGAFPLQFGSISPGFMNGMQIPARTSSAPPNLDEQKCDQARHDSSEALSTLPIPSAPKSLQLKKDVGSTNQPVIVGSHPPSQAKRDVQVQISATPVATTTRKSTAIPIIGMSMPMAYQQPQISLQFGSISPGFMNGMQIPARTSSAPPNLDEQKCDQARHDSSKALSTLPIPSAPKSLQLKKDVGSTNQPVIVGSHPPSQAKRDVQVQISATPVATTTRKSTAIPITGMSMPMAYQQPQISLQFGSISPGFMNGMQIPARTSSAPPNLDEQKCDQARHDSSKALSTLPIPSAPKSLQLKKDVGSTNQPVIVGSHPPSQAKRDVQVQISATPVATTTQKSTAIPITGMSMLMAYQQPQISLQFGGPSAQMQSQGVTTSSIQMPMSLLVGNATQVQQQVFVPGLPSIPLQPQGMMHQGQSLGFSPQMGHQLGPQLSNLGIGVAPQFNPQQAGKFGGSRRTVKITHPVTHEELKLGKRTDTYSDVGSSGPGSPPNLPPQSQPIHSFSPANPINYFSPIQPNSYNPSIFSSNPSSLPLTSTHMTPGSSATRYNYPVGQGGPPIHSTHTSASVSMPGLPSCTSSVPVTPAEESAAVMTNAEGQRREPVKRSNSLKDQQRKPSKKELCVSQQHHQADSADSGGNLKSSLLKLPGDLSSSDYAGQVSKNPVSARAPFERIGEPTTLSSMPSPNLKCNVSSLSEIEEGKTESLSESSGKILEASAEVSQDAHAGRCDVSTTLADGVLDGEGDPCEPPNPFGLESDGNASEQSDATLFTKLDVRASLDVGLKQETMVTLEHMNARIPDGSSHDFINLEVPTGSIISVSTEGDKQTEVALQHGTNEEKINVVGESICAETKLTNVNAVVGCNSEVGRTVDNLVRSSTTSSVSIDGTVAPSSHISSTDAPEEETSSTVASKTESEKGTPSEEVVMTESGLLSQEVATAPPSALSEMSQKHEGIGAESASSDQTSSSLLGSKDKTSMEYNRTKSTVGKRKKWREILSKADAAGSSSDLYMAYKGPEEKNEISVTSGSVDSSVDMWHAYVDSTERDTIVAEDDGQNKSELDDWEDAAEIPTPELKTSENGDLVHASTKHDDGYGGGVMGKNKYSRDFLMTFSEQCNDLPAGFKIGSDIVGSVMSGPVDSSYLVDRDSYTSSGRFIDRPTGGSRLDRHGSGIVDDDKWGKTPGSFSPGRDPRLDVTHGGVAVNLRPGQAGNHGVLRNPRGQSSVQYVGGILSGPMQALASPGGMARNSPDVDRWQRATGFQKGLTPAPQTPLQVMHKAERKYEVGKVSDEEEGKQRQLKGILNKLTPQNFDKLFEQVKEVNIDSAGTLTGVISQIFDKALMEPTFCEMYADFCSHLAGALPDFIENSEKITFKRLLLNKCQEEFERGEREQAEACRVEEGQIKQSDEEREEKKVKARRRMLGNILLIGELYKKKMLTERIMHECIKKLLGQHQSPDEEDIESLCKLMSTIGEMIDHPKAKEHMDAYFEMMLKLSNNHKLSSRVRFMLKDAIDLRKNKWQQRRKIEGPKKIEEVHRDAAQERQLQTSRLSRGGSSISSARRGPPIDYGPRGTTTSSSSNAQQMNGPRSLPPQIRGYGVQDVRLEDRRSLERRMLSVPLPQRPIDDDSITLGPQGGLARGMSIRGQPLMPSVALADVSSTTWDPRRMASSPNGYSSASDWAPYNSREEPIPRHMPEMFMATPASEQSNSLKRNTSFGSRDSRNVDRSFDRSMTASPATGRIQGSSIGVQNFPFAAKFSEDYLRNKSISAIREYYSARNDKEVCLCIKELNSLTFYPDMVMLWVTDSFDRKNDIDRDLLAKLLVNLYKSRDGLLTQVQLIKGFEAVLSTLEDAVTDSPKAAEYLGLILGKVILENVVPLKEIGRIIHDGGDEPGRLLEIGLASDVLVSILEIIKRDRGDSILNEMRMSSNLKLEDFRHPDPIKSRRLDAFM